MAKKLFLLIAFFCSIRAFPQSPFLIGEGFNSYPTVPSGWTFSSGISNYTTASYCGKNIPALKFSHTGDQVTTTTWSNGDQITFLIRANTTINSTDNMKVEVYDGSAWSTLANIQPHDKSAKVATLSISTSIIQARFTYTKGAANTSLDDFTVRKAASCSGSGIKLSFINVDACGSGCEGQDEFFTFSPGNTAMNLSDIEYSYPDANNNNVTVCGTSAGTCAYYVATNSAAVAALNALAGCSIFISPTTSVPANSKVIVFNGNPQAHTTDFSSLCGTGAQYYAIFTNNTSDCNGRFGNYSTSGDTYRDMFMRNRSTGCTDTNYYFTDNVGLSDGNGNNVDGASVYFTGATPKYTLTNCSSYDVLPISLLSFYATSRNNKIHLIWITASEQDNNYFSIEKSGDGVNFEVESIIAGAGNSTSELQYSFDDLFPIAGVNYYRLRQTDYNGGYSLSKTIAVNVMEDEPIYIYPNPFNDKIYLRHISFTAKRQESSSPTHKQSWATAGFRRENS